MNAKWHDRITRQIKSKIAGLESSLSDSDGLDEKEREVINRKAIYMNELLSKHLEMVGYWSCLGIIKKTP